MRWETLWILMLILYIPSCIGLIVIVLLQKGKGTGFAGAFGIGPGSDTVFGPRGSKSLPARLTHVMAAIFMILALAMSMISGRVGKGIAPDKVEGPDELGAFGPVSYDGLLDDLGSGIAGSDVAAPPETPAPTEAVPEAVPGEAEAEVVEPPGEGMAAPVPPEGVTVTIAPPPSSITEPEAAPTDGS